MLYHIAVITIIIIILPVYYYVCVLLWTLVDVNDGSLADMQQINTMAITDQGRIKRSDIW